jgi:ribose/xylose/arabinose/galactoside ABC-type transport system permease subunit
MLVSIGVLLIAAGLLLSLAGKTGLRLGQLPGDLVWRGKGTTLYFPVTTCIVISVIISLLSWLFRRP